jgi:hypothetical protein
LELLGSGSGPLSSLAPSFGGICVGRGAVVGTASGGALGRGAVVLTAEPGTVSVAIGLLEFEPVELEVVAGAFEPEGDWAALPSESFPFVPASSAHAQASARLVAKTVSASA